MKIGSAFIQNVILLIIDLVLYSRRKEPEVKFHLLI
jgi:hypothetical protein